MKGNDRNVGCNFVSFLPVEGRKTGYVIRFNGKQEERLPKHSCARRVAE